MFAPPPDPLRDSDLQQPQLLVLAWSRLSCQPLELRAPGRRRGLNSADISLRGRGGARWNGSGLQTATRGLTDERLCENAGLAYQEAWLLKDLLFGGW